jgi:hypothetical protein
MQRSSCGLHWLMCVEPPSLASLDSKPCLAHATFLHTRSSPQTIQKVFISPVKASAFQSPLLTRTLHPKLPLLSFALAAPRLIDVRMRPRCQQSPLTTCIRATPATARSGMDFESFPGRLLDAHETSILLWAVRSLSSTRPANAIHPTQCRAGVFAGVCTN